MVIGFVIVGCGGKQSLSAGLSICIYFLLLDGVKAISLRETPIFTIPGDKNAPYYRFKVFSIITPGFVTISGDKNAPYYRFLTFSIIRGVIYPFL
jgi:hypothetical protein